MAVNIGIWVDHEKAFIVRLIDGKAKLQKIESGAESHYHFSGGSRSKSPYGPQLVSSEHKYEERRTHHLKKYYRNIADHCKDMDRLFIFGPGEAKGELYKEIASSKELAGRIESPETVDKMTENQIVAEVKKHFLR
ncbi:MAG: hypothetical protein JXQ30_07660 [Spirochaetes bacterium]|nr:hypothetical protein [Spirochaetota bacterium]